MLCSDIVRFRTKFLVRETGCWEWLGHIMWAGYGLFWAQGKTRRAHRWAYENFIGPIPEGLHLDHLCKNKVCVNPEHLDPVTREENLRRTQKKTCIYGHLKEGENLYIAPKSKQRQCRTCHRLKERKRREGKRNGLVV